MDLSLPLTTDRLLITPMTVDDASALAAYRSEPDVARFQSWAAPFPLEQAVRMLRGNPQGPPAPGEWAQLAIRERGRVVGDIAVHPLDDPVQPGTVELGVTLGSADQGRGIAAQALGAVVLACFAGGVQRVVASCDARNAPVARLLARVGLRHEARQVDAERWKGEWTTVDTWAVLARERS